MRVVEIVPVRVVEIVPLFVVEMVPALVVEMTPVLVVEIVPVLANVVAETAITNIAAKTIVLRFFIACSCGVESHVLRDRPVDLPGSLLQAGLAKK